MSEFNVEVVPVGLEPHFNADTLSVVRVFDGYTVIVRTEDWVNVSQAAYVPPDSVVPDKPEYAFLEGKLRIKAKTLRGLESYGMLVPAPPGSQIGDNVAEELGIIHYEPEMDSSMITGKSAESPDNSGVHYNINSWRKYRNLFEIGEEVVITEKIHGANSRYTFQGNRMYCGSHRQWQAESENNTYWKILKLFPWVEAFCRLNPNTILYGEIFGKVQKGFNYGSDNKNPLQFRAFDVWANGRFLDYDNALGGAKSDFLVPVLYRGPYSIEKVEQFTNGPSVLPGAAHIREGVVIKPVIERYVPRIYGRLILKSISIDYLSGKKKK